MYINEVKHILSNCFSAEKIHVSMYGNHYQIIVIDQIFFGKNKLERHKMVYASLTKFIKDNKIHSISIYTFDPKEWKKQYQLYKNRYNIDL